MSPVPFKVEVSGVNNQGRRSSRLFLARVLEVDTGVCSAGDYFANICHRVFVSEGVRGSGVNISENPLYSIPIAQRVGGAPDVSRLSDP